MGRNEAAAVAGLAAAYADLQMLPPEADENGGLSGVPSIDVQSEMGHMFCCTFLRRMEACAEALRLDIAPRDFRSEFSVNYCALFPDGARHYRVDVLEASIDRHQVVWVNGDKFELSAETIGFAEELQRGLADLGSILSRREGAEQLFSRDELAAVLTRIDVAWAAFEHKYITNLIVIEDRARQLVVKAVEAERRLRRLEASLPRSTCRGSAPPEYMAAQRALVECISRLNAVANHRRKGRDDLGGDILESALAALSYGRREEGGNRHSAAQVLAEDIVGAFDAIREYLQKVKSQLPRVDPHLCNNPGLTARLVDWEESWEVGGRYVRHAPLLDALCDLVTKMQGIQMMTPTLATMCEECDVELFLVLPRITLLAFLVHPEGKQAELLKVLLPHRFNSETGAAALPELEELIKQFHATSHHVASAATPLFAGATGLTQSSYASSAARAFAWEVLVRRAVDGDDGVASSLDRFPPAIRGDVQKVTDDFGRVLEKWSVELQRHCPEDWNQCSAVLVQCLTGASKRHKFVKFQV